MTQGKERIYISLEKEISPYIGDFMLIKDKYLTYSEAIETMAKEMARRELLRMEPRFNPTKEEYESIWAYEVLPSTQTRFRDQAKAALNALLGVEK